MVDAASRFSAAWVLEKEDAECAIKAIQRAWIRPYGPPKIIQCDEQRAFCSGQFQQFCNQNNIEPWIAPGEAHWKLGVVERRHPVLRKAIELYLRDNNLPPGRNSAIQALDHIVPVMNTLSFTRGYTPAQWVLGQNPAEHNSLTADKFNPSVHHTALTEQEYHDELVRRNTARVAFLKALSLIHI